MTTGLMANVTSLAVNGRGVLIKGPPGSGKSSLALALIDRGAVLVGDDGVALECRDQRLWAHPPPNIAGRIEVRGIGIVAMPTTSAPVCLVLSLDEAGDRLPQPGATEVMGIAVPELPFRFGPDAALRAEWALNLHGLIPPPRLV